MKIAIPEGALAIIRRLNAAGYEAYAVGGCVRDMLLGDAPADWDITTSARPDETLQVFFDKPVLRTGIAHGTVTILMDHVPFEVTTYRVDGDYSDHRHPEQVRFVTSLTEDLRRRDFTINAMAWHPDHGLIDPFCGAEDLHCGIIRAVGDPPTRFTEDALRILRGLRFASRFDFTIEAATARAMNAQRDSISLVSAERIYAEFKKTLLGKAIARIMETESEVFFAFLPEARALAQTRQNNPHHTFPVWQHTAIATGAIAPEAVLRLTMFFHDIGKPMCYARGTDGFDHFKGHPPKSVEITAAVLARLRAEKQLTQRVLMLIREHDTIIRCTRADVTRMLVLLGEEVFWQLMAVKRADIMGKRPEHIARMLREMDALAALAKTICDEPHCFSIAEMAVNGNDLLACGIPAGAEIGRTLSQLFRMVVAGDVRNERDALLAMLKKI